VYDRATRLAAVARLERGASLRSVSRATGINRATLRQWRERGVEPRTGRPPCPRCHGRTPAPARDYVYLLGLYLGDGCISEHPRTTALRVACCDGWPGLMDECERAVAAVAGGRKIFRVTDVGSTTVTCLWRHWPCLFPQHGPGRKHERRIELAPWQQELVDADPRPLVRGLIHSDGCRLTNWTERTVGGTRKRYTYPRYLFSNSSADILRIYTDALDALGVEWRANRWNSISVARRRSVAVLDAFVGPKS
jgi:hypothetical protein